MRLLDKIPPRPVPNLVWELVIVFFVVQLTFELARIFRSGVEAVYVNPMLFALMYFFAALGFAGTIFAFVFLVVYAWRWASLRFIPESHRPEEDAKILHLPDGQKRVV